MVDMYLAACRLGGIHVHKNTLEYITYLTLALATDSEVSNF